MRACRKARLQRTLLEALADGMSAMASSRELRLFARDLAFVVLTSSVLGIVGKAFVVAMQP